MANTGILCDSSCSLWQSNIPMLFVGVLVDDGVHTTVQSILGEGGKERLAMRIIADGVIKNVINRSTVMIDAQSYLRTSADDKQMLQE